MPYFPIATARLLGQTVNVNFRASTGWGTAPAQMMLTCPLDALQAVQGEVTDLTIAQGDTSLVWVDVRIRSIDTAEPGDSGLMRVTLEDRRWRWQFGFIDGDFNVLKQDQTLKRERTPQQLARLLSIAMGEPTLNVSALPNEARPRKAWRAANPRQELDRLCAELGCVVAFDGPGDSATIVRIGDGSIPADFGPQVSRTDGIVIPPWPSEVRIVTSPVLFQSKLQFFEAVGEDTDGKIKPIDQLSYAPAGGWAKCGDPFEFLDIESTYLRGGETLQVRELALKSVFRWYRITGQAAGGWSPTILAGTPFEPTGRDDIGPFLDTRLDRDEGTGNRLPIMVVGVFSDERETGENTNAGAKFKGSARVNNETKCVEFDEPLFRWSGADGKSGDTLPAQLWVYVGYQCSKEGVPIRYERFQPVTGPTYGAGPRIEHHEEIVREVLQERPFQLTGDDNLAKVEAEADHYLAAVLAEYDSLPSANPVLPNIQYYAPNGVLRQIQWQGGSTTAPTTQLAYNGELNEYMPDFRDTPEARARRIAEQAARERAALLNGRLGPPKE